MDPPLTVVPADMFLLAGDTIVNESMLTGESVPVSKIPIKDEDVARWQEMTDISGEVTKSFLYAGTRVIRVRGGLTTDGTNGPPALGLVVRSGGSFDRFYEVAHIWLTPCQRSTPRRAPSCVRCSSRSPLASSSTVIPFASFLSLRAWPVWAFARVPCSS